MSKPFIIDLEEIERHILKSLYGHYAMKYDRIITDDNQNSPEIERIRAKFNPINEEYYNRYGKDIE
jgi:hypothetical protein